MTMTTTTTAPKLTRWRIFAFVVAFLGFTLAGSGAWAYWSAGSAAGGSGASLAATVPQGATPTAVSAGTSVTVSWAAATLSNGTAVAGYIVKRYNASTGVLQTIGSGCTGTVTATSCTETSIPNGQWQYTDTPVFATNWVGTESAKSSVAYTDPTPPTNSLSLTNITGSAALSGTTVYYVGASAGSFTISNAVVDTGSGPASSTTSTLGGTTTGWTTSPSTVSLPTGGPYVSSAFSWTAGTTSSPTEIVTGRDLANNQTTTGLTFVNDSTPPTGSISYTNGYQVGRYVTLTFSGADSGSGLVTAQLQRSSATFVNGTCLSFGAWTNLGSANPVSPYTDSSVSNSMCYNYRYVLADLVGNTYTATTSSTAWVDYAGAVRYETPGIVSYLRFGDSSVNGNTTAADIVGSNNATYHNSPTLGVSGDPLNDSDTAVTLNGTNQYIQDTSPVGLPVGSSSRSVELWFKTSAQTHQSLFTYGSFAVNEEFGLWIEPAGGSLTAWGWGGGDDPTFTNSASVEDGKWHQVVEVWNGTAITLYVNGVSLGSQNMTRNTVVDSYGLQIGDVVEPNDPNSAGYFNGSLDEFSIYNVALTATQVLNHYQLGANTTAGTGGPTGGSVVVSGLAGTGSLYSTSTTLNLTLNKGTDANGLGSPAYLFRATAPLTSTGNADGVCGTFGAYSLVATDPATPYSDTVADQACYVYRYSVPDSLGNYGTYSSGLIKVDTTAPVAPTFVFSGLTATYAAGSILYYRPTATTGSVTVTVTTTDTTSGISAYAFPTFGTNWTTSGTGAARTYSWAATPAGSGTETVTVTNNAGSSSSATFTLTPDSTAPTGGSISSVNGSQTSHTTPITFVAGTDSGSGVGTVAILESTATYSTLTGLCGTQSAYNTTVVTNPASSPYSDTALAKGCYMFELKVTDNVGNVSIYTSTSVLKVTQ
jgi:hypothetical protein